MSFNLRISETICVLKKGNGTQMNADIQDLKKNYAV